jgi:hypothetical protein
VILKALVVFQSRTRTRSFKSDTRGNSILREGHFKPSFKTLQISFQHKSCFILLLSLASYIMPPISSSRYVNVPFLPFSDEKHKSYFQEEKIVYFPSFAINTPWHKLAWKEITRWKIVFDKFSFSYRLSFSMWWQNGNGEATHNEQKDVFQPSEVSNGNKYISMPLKLPGDISLRKTSRSQ